MNDRARDEFRESGRRVSRRLEGRVPDAGIGRGNSTRTRDWLRPVLSVTTGAAVGQAALVVALPVLTRLFGAADLGRFAVLVALSNFLALACTGKLELLLPQSETERRAPVADLAGGLALVLAPVLSGVVIALGLLDFGVSGGLAYLVLTGATFSNAIVNVGVMASLAEARAVPVARARFAVGFVQSAIHITVGIVAPEFWVLGAGYVVANVLAYWILRTRFDHLGRSLKKRAVVACAQFRPSYSFASVSTASALSSNAFIATSTIGIEVLFGAATTGAYFVARRMLLMPVQLLASALGEQFYVSASQEESAQAIRKAAVARLRIVVPLAVVMIIAVIVLMPLVTPVLGSTFEQVPGILAALLPVAVGQLVVTPFGNALLALGLEHQRLWWNLARLVLLAAWFGCVHRLGLGFTPAIWGVSIVTSVGYLVMCLLLLRATGRQPMEAAQ